jgi:hypothetical protein
MFTELFCGIGGLAACLPEVSGGLAIDINRNALAIHEQNFPSHRRLCKTIESLRPDDLRDAPRGLWWMSPPCQPYTRRGRQRDLDDPRAAAFRHLLTLIERIRPRNLGLENVPAFARSRSRQKLLDVLCRCDYRVREITLCATRLGSRNRRRRYYLIASRVALAPFAVPVHVPAAFRLQEPLETQSFRVPPDWLNRYGARGALHIVEESALRRGLATTICFTSAYGRSPVYSGSYLRASGHVRFFTPREVLWQLGFPADFSLPDWHPSRLWPLAGNTLSLLTVRYLLQHLSADGTSSPVQPSLHQ